MNKNCVCFFMGIAAFLLMSLPAYAVCINPSGVEADLIYNSDNLVAQYCDDTNWVAVTKRKAFSSGDCINPVRTEGAIIYNEAQNVPQICIGQWIALGPLNPGAGTGGCSNPVKTEGTVIYNQGDKVMQYCDGSQYVQLLGAPPVDSCPNVTNSGDACPDDSLYVGPAPVGNVRLFTTRCDIGQTWDGSSCLGTSSFISWNNNDNTGYVDLPNASSYEKGRVNHNIIIATDSDSGVLGKQPHRAAQACEDLVEHGHSDWYLPAMDELQDMYDNRVALGNFQLSRYWTSTEYDYNDTRYRDFSNGNQSRVTKDYDYRVRCVRK